MRRKADINNNRKRPKKYHEGGIYWVYFGENIGFEQDGRGEGFSRPALIVHGFHSGLVWCVPITHTDKVSQYYFPINLGRVQGCAILSQLRPVDTLRLSDLIDVVPDKTLAEVKQALSNIMLS